MHRRPSHIVISLVMTLLAIFAFTTHSMVGSIPPPKPNQMGDETADFLLNGRYEAINWRPIGEDAFIEARHSGKPILMVIGTAWSWLGRRFDADVFTTTDIQNYLNREFVCIRIDADEHPEWANAFLPVSRNFGDQRGSNELLPSFQIWYLDQRGTLSALETRSAANTVVDRATLLKDFIKQDHTLTDNTESGKPTNDIQKTDLAMITAGSGKLDYATLLGKLRNGIHPKYGGYAYAGYRALVPEALRLQILTGDNSDASVAVRPALISQPTDILDGGFFVVSRLLDWTAIEFDKPAVLQAGMLRALNLYSWATHDPAAEFASRRTFSYLLNGMVKEGYLVASSVGDADTVFGRSPQHSISRTRLDEALTDPADRSYAWDKLNLNAGPNPQMVPHVSSADEYVNPQFLAVTDRLAHNASGPHLAGFGYLDVNGYSVARMLESARFWQDSTMTMSAGELLDRLEAFRERDDVRHGMEGKSTSQRYLGDYLAYTDACLQDYLASGRTVSFDNGLRVLRRALFLFQGSRPGEMLSIDTPADSPLAAARSPELADPIRESCLAMLMRLCNTYSRLLQDRPPLGDQLRKTAVDVYHLFGAVASGGKSGPTIGVSGFFSSSLDLADSAYAVAVGQGAVTLATQTYHLRPDRLCAPAVGLVRRDLQSRAAGVYVVMAGKVEGPLTPADAAQKLGPLAPNPGSI